VRSRGCPVDRDCDYADALIALLFLDDGLFCLINRQITGQIRLNRQLGNSHHCNFANGQEQIMNSAYDVADYMRETKRETFSHDG